MNGSSSLASDLCSLSKPRITMLLTLTGLGGMLAAGGISIIPGFGFLLAVSSMAGGSAALNCWYDRHLDARMQRTRHRPLPSGRLPPWVGLVQGLGLVALSTGVCLWLLPLRTLVYLWMGLGSYVGLYTLWLKRNHWLGVVLGGSAGSFPVLAGWSAVEPTGPAAWIMAALVFAWTPPHAWALAHVYREDFRTGDIPTLPVVSEGEGLHGTIFASALLTAAIGLVLIPYSSILYTGTVLLSTPLFIMVYGIYYMDRNKPAAASAFFTANLFLSCLFVAWGAGGLIPSSLQAHLVPLTLVFPFLFFRMWDANPSLGPVDSRAIPSPREFLKILQDTLRS